VGSIAPPQRPMHAAGNELVGTWNLARAEHVDGSTATPVREPRGVIIFDSAGRVFEIVTQNYRQPYATNQPTPEEALAAFNSFQGFWGSYKRDEKQGKITYHPQGAVNPTLMGQDLVRGIELNGNTLVTTSQPGESGLQGTMRWTWDRVPTIENLSPAYRQIMGFWQWVGDKNVDVASGDTLTEAKRDPSIIVYSPAGYIGTLFVPANRKPLAGALATAEEAKADIAGYVGYIALLTMHPGGTIFHDQLITIAPGGGGSLERAYDIKDNELHLNFPPVTVQGKLRQTRVVLRRLSGVDEMLGTK
jgi:hypothetical protein